MNGTQNDATVLAGAGIAVTEPAAGAAAVDGNAKQNACQTAGEGKNEMSAEQIVKMDAAVATATLAAAEAAGLTTEVVLVEEKKAAPNSRTGGKAGKAKKGKDRELVVMIPFGNVTVSKWNASYGTKLDEGHVKELAENIRKNGLMHPVTLTHRNGESGTTFTILAGARRVAALRLLRGEGSGLQESEFKLHDNLDESMPKCLEFSLAENKYRYGRSVTDLAAFISRMLRGERIDQKKLAGRVNMRREQVNRLAKLADCLGSLPECWLRDLSYSPKSGGKVPKKSELPKIMMSHWVEVAGRIGDDCVIDESLKAVMETAHKKGWSSGRLRRELKATVAAAVAVEAAVAETAAADAEPANVEVQADAGSPAAEPSANAGQSAEARRVELLAMLERDPGMADRLISEIQSKVAAAGDAGGAAAARQVA